MLQEWTGCARGAGHFERAAYCESRSRGYAGVGWESWYVHVLPLH